MLVLSRKVAEKILIERGITITVLETSRSRVRLGIEAPLNVSVRRSEIAFDTTPLVNIPLPEFATKPSL